MEEKIKTILPDISKLKEEQLHATKILEEKYYQLKQEADIANQGFVARSAKIEEELHLLKGKR